MIKKMLSATLALGSSLGLLLAADQHSPGSGNSTSARSTFASDHPAPKELTLTFTEEGANRTQVLKGIAADGSATDTSWTAPLTGGTVSFPAGQGPNGGASAKLVDERTLVMTQNLSNGRRGASRTYQISADGKTLTLTRVGEDGQERAKLAFNRQ